MKKICLFFIISAFFVACNDDTEIDGVNIVGKWCLTDNPEEVDEYIEFTKNALYDYELRDNDGDYYYGYATFSNGHIYTPKNAMWKLLYKNNYEIIDNNLFVDGQNLGTLIAINKNKFRYVSKTSLAGIYERIKGFEPKPAVPVENESEKEDVNIKNEHEYVDLNLPSGTLWATCNIGANSSEEYGDYYAWGETAPKSFYSWSTNIYSNGTETTLTKYCTSTSYGYNAFTDNKTELELADDAAYVNWGSDWRIPSYTQMQELYNSDYTIITWTSQNGIYGEMIVSKSNENSLFLPAAGYRSGYGIYMKDSSGHYWSRSLITDASDHAYGPYFESDNVSWNDGYRDSGRSIRPVRVSQ